MQEEESTRYGIAAFFSAVLFGIIHVAGPGHGKVFTITYFGSKRATFREGMLLSGVINLIDSLSAGILVLLGYGLLTVVFSEFRGNTIYVVQLISYGFVTLFGVAHLVHHVRHSGHDHEVGSDSFRPPWLLALSIGLVPCPVSTLILVFGLANGILGFSLLLVAGVSFGGFITMAVLALAVIGGKKGLVRFLDGSQAPKVLTVIEYVSSSLIIAAGVFLFIAAL
jgi:ABC-type nickel/cobalt efflux system permease component RcnA